MPLRLGLTPKERITILVQNRGLEWFSTFVMIWWSICLALPGDTLAGSNFIAFHRYSWMTEEFWASAFGIIGGIRFLALCINGHAKTRTPYYRMAGSVFGAVTWAQVACLFGEGSVIAVGTGVGVYALLALADLVSIFRAAFDARYHNP